MFWYQKSKWLKADKWEFKQFPDLAYQDTFAADYIDAPFELKVTNEHCLTMLGMISDYLGVDVIEEVLGHA